MTLSVPRVIRRVVLGFAALVLVVVLVATAYAVNVVQATYAGVARVDGTVAGLPLHGPVTIVRDDRDVPHIRAGDEHDLFFAQGYVTGSDRLFQMDVTRRYVLGRLSELLGPPVLALDETQRVLDARAMTERQYAQLAPEQKAMLQAYADGVNAAAAREPTPPEYRALFARFERWRPEDVLVAGTATVVDLTDSWYDIVDRDAIRRSVPAAVRNALFPLSDERYPASTAGDAQLAVPTLPPFPHTRPATAALRDDRVASRDDDARAALGSNEWVAGGGLTATGRALLANDPHLARGVPGVWHLVDLQAPGFHAAGATFAGVPGVILGHNAHLAWGSTNGTVASPRVYAERFLDATHYAVAGEAPRAATLRTEVFHVRFAGDRTVQYAATRHGFVLEREGKLRHAVQWDPAEDPRSPIAAFDRLDRAVTFADAEAALAAYPGPTQNFVVAADDGRAAYHLAGFIPDDPHWALDAIDGTTATPAPLRFVPFTALPQRAPSRTTLAVSSNNVQYGAGYRYRLSPAYTPPYRAAEITRRLRALHGFTVADFAAIQNDDLSLPDRELAQAVLAAVDARGLADDPELRAAVAALRSFDGALVPESRGATAAARVRAEAVREFAARILPAREANAYAQLNPPLEVLLQTLREHPAGWLDDPDAFLVEALRAAVRNAGGPDAIARPYGEAFAVVPRHPLAAFGMFWWNAPTLPGRSGAYAPAVQSRVLGQSFRAVWDVGNWDGGGIAIPVGESGEPGSPHYTDLAAAWQRRELAPLPWSPAAVARAARTTETLTP
jgi:penicillin amidase